MSYILILFSILFCLGFLLFQESKVTGTCHICGAKLTSPRNFHQVHLDTHFENYHKGQK